MGSEKFEGIVAIVFAVALFPMLFALLLTGGLALAGVVEFGFASYVGMLLVVYALMGIVRLAQ